ncbi:glutamyl-tRNA amidotransferase subunit A [Tothia fuscella]|uniref:Glutamyl-tRNA amidotransferase subunit A n=1 Tax=Tothia fuscella TaxID=1048955 RepID=A0A9P4U5E8_9PEZI|nr:glutamyl-tRNA amidotransferase subunit A [Tothia fuscella]
MLLLYFTIFTSVTSRHISPEGWGQAQPTFPRLMNATIESLTVGLESKLFSSVDLVIAYARRIAEVNSTLNVVTELNPDALEIAKQLDLERSNGKSRGVLHGIPILIKNNIATMDRMNNTAGSWALVGAKVPRDSTMARKLREAGAIILGKTNLSQWANFRSQNSSNGWSAYGGQVYAAYYPKQDPSGSSSGSGVASSLGLALGSLGTETDGSIVSPAEKNNLVGIKPTVGLTSRALVIPISEHQDSIGPMTRTVKDAAYILQAIAGIDPADNYTSAIPGKIRNYLKACNPLALSGAKIGIPRNVISLTGTKGSPELIAFEKALTTMRNAGADVVVSNFTSASAQLMSQGEIQVLNADFIVNLASYLAQLTSNPTNVKSLSDVRQFTQSFPLEEYPSRDTKIWDQALFTQKWNNTDPRFWKAYQQNLKYSSDGGLLDVISRQKLDAVILPTSIASSWAATVGAPIITVPLGFYPLNAPVKKNTRGNLVASGPNVPFGLSFLGAKWTEEKLIGLAYAFEQKTLVRNMVQPYLVPKTEIADVVKKGRHS